MNIEIVFQFIGLLVSTSSIICLEESEDFFDCVWSLSGRWLTLLGIALGFIRGILAANVCLYSVN